MKLFVVLLSFALVAAASAGPKPSDAVEHWVEQRTDEVNSYMETALEDLKELQGRTSPDKNKMIRQKIDEIIKYFEGKHEEARSYEAKLSGPDAKILKDLVESYEFVIVGMARNRKHFED